MIRVDPHVHVWKNDPAFPWAPETKTPPAEDATAEMLLELMAANGIDHTVLVQVIHYRWDNRYAAHVFKLYPQKFSGVARVNPEDPASPEHLSALVAEGFQGVRLSPAADASGDWFTGPLMEPLFQRAEQLRVPMLILTRPSRLPDLTRHIERHPDLDVVIDHMADCSPTDSNEQSQLLAMARYPRVFVKISHTWSISSQSYPWSDTHDLVRKVHQAFGADRLMWGTDWPVCLQRATYPQTLSVVRDEMRFFTAEEQEWLQGKTALRLWRFGR